MDLVSPKPPEEIFPLEVWGLILDHLTSPSDLINCTKVCQAWDKLLEPQKTTFLMPQVFPILYKYFEDDEVDDELDDEEDDEDENDKEIEPMTTILRMRLVSNSWKQTVDTYFQNHPALNDIGFNALTDTKYSDHFEPIPFVPYHFGRYGNSEGTAVQIENFLGKGFSPESNPFITRYVSYSENVYRGQPHPSSHTAFKNLLEAFGSHIWTCDLLFKSQASKGDIYKLVSSYLKLMPNLKSLKLELYGRYDNEKPRRGEQKEILEQLLQNEPIPQLKHLKKLQMSNLTYPLSVGILTSNSHLQKLSFKIGGMINAAVLPNCVANVQLPNLKQLTFPRCEEELLNFPKGSWPINILHLKGEIPKLKNVFQAVSSNFSSTLEHFVVAQYDTIESNKELAQTRLRLPKLKMLQLSTEFELKTIDFLQGCPALQEIQLAFKISHKNKEDDEDSSNSSSAVIQFKDCITSMNQSNIWRILKNLESIKLKRTGMDGKRYPAKIHKFTRRHFEKISNPTLPGESDTVRE
ncbi:unnamed protein product [Orchesella dallaii]|uniref:F-box domain-containing protein n=1 Tax=Orchesella dallaii TaxID=48710 RepID=A0ABP1RYF9_9HEXA